MLSRAFYNQILHVKVLFLAVFLKDGACYSVVFFRILLLRRYFPCGILSGGSDLKCKTKFSIHVALKYFQITESSFKLCLCLT